MYKKKNRRLIIMIILVSIILSLVHTNTVYANEIENELILPTITINKFNNEESNLINEEQINDNTKKTYNEEIDFKENNELKENIIPNDIIYINEELEFIITPAELSENTQTNDYSNGSWGIKNVEEDEIIYYSSFYDIIFDKPGIYEIYFQDKVIHNIDIRINEENKINAEITENAIIPKEDNNINNIETTKNIENTEQQNKEENNELIKENKEIIKEKTEEPNILKEEENKLEINPETINNSKNIEINTFDKTSKTQTFSIPKTTYSLENKVEENLVNYNDEDTLSLSIPKKLELDAENKNNYKIKIDGNMDKYKSIEIKTCDNFTLTNEFNEQIEVDIINNTYTLTSKEIENGLDEIVFNMKLDELPIGTWNGNFQLTINTDDPEPKKTTTNSNDEITLIKHVDYIYDNNNDIITDENGNPEIKVTFTVNTKNLKTETETLIAQNTDIVLIMDTSGSMKDNSKIEQAKTNAKDFINKVLAIEGLDVNIGIVSFGENATIIQKLSNDKEKLNSSIDNLKADGGTFLQAGIYKGQEILKKGTGDSKIMIILSDGLPTYRYEFNKKYLFVEDKKTVTIDAPLAYNTTYTAYTNFNYSNDSVLFDNGDEDYEWNNFSSKLQLGYDSTISQAYLARNEIPNLHIYSIGYDIESGKSAETILKNIADKDKYLLASIDTLDTIIDEVTTEVEKTIEGVNIVSYFPKEITYIENSFMSESNISLTKINKGIKMTWNEALESNKTYSMSFETSLNRNLLNNNLIGHYFNICGSILEKNGIGKDSSYIIYGLKEDEIISLNSSQLKLYN